VETDNTTYVAEAEYPSDVPHLSGSQESPATTVGQYQVVTDIIERLSRLEESVSCRESNGNGTGTGSSGNKSSYEDHRNAGGISLGQKNSHFLDANDNTAEMSSSTSMEIDEKSTLLPVRQIRRMFTGGATSSHHIIAALDDHLCETSTHAELEPASFSACPFTSGHDLPEFCIPDLRCWVRRAQANDRYTMYQTLKRYFVYLNPHCE